MGIEEQAQRSKDWPHDHLSDDTIKAKVVESLGRPRALTVQTMNMSALSNRGVRCGWPLQWQSGTDHVVGNVTPGLEQQGRSGAFAGSGTCWPPFSSWGAMRLEPPTCRAAK